MSQSPARPLVPPRPDFTVFRDALERQHYIDYQVLCLINGVPIQDIPDDHQFFSRLMLFITKHVTPLSIHEQPRDPHSPLLAVGLVRVCHTFRNSYAVLEETFARDGDDNLRLLAALLEDALCLAQERGCAWIEVGDQIEKRNLRKMIRCLDRATLEKLMAAHTERPRFVLR